jgi:hypothetical protein
LRSFSIPASKATDAISLLLVPLIEVEFSARENPLTAGFLYMLLRPAGRWYYIRITMLF